MKFAVYLKKSHQDNHSALLQRTWKKMLLVPIIPEFGNIRKVSFNENLKDLISSSLLRAWKDLILFLLWVSVLLALNLWDMHVWYYSVHSSTYMYMYIIRKNLLKHLDHFGAWSHVYSLDDYHKLILIFFFFPQGHPRPKVHQDGGRRSMTYTNHRGNQGYVFRNYINVKIW